VAYPDETGVPTIGYGHTKGVQLGLTCSQDQAERWLMDDVQEAAADVNALVKVPLTQHEFDALVDFTFNVGAGNLKHSTLLQLVNTQRFADAAKEFDKWSYAGGHIVAGLLRRRQAEHTEFLTADAAG
jgi:lysozyme